MTKDGKKREKDQFPQHKCKHEHERLIIKQFQAMLETWY